MSSSRDPERAREYQREYRKKHPERVKEYQRRARERNAEKLNQGKREYYQRVKDTPEYKAKSAAYVEKNKEKKREYDKERHALIAEKVKERVKEWNKNNPEARRAIVLAYDSKRRSQKANGSSAREIREWSAAQVKDCYWCGEGCSDNYHIDHYQPLSKGGLHEIANLVISCPTCNQRKSAKDPYEFAQSVGRLF